MKAFDQLSDTVAAQRGLVARRQVLLAGVREAELRWRIRPEGPWQVILPGVYATFTGGMSTAQWWQAGLLYGGDRAVLTGEPALMLWGVINEQRSRRVPILVDAGYQRASRKHVSVFRTYRMPASRHIDGFLVADPVRATADACRILPSIRDVRAVITEALRSSKVSFTALGREVRDGQRRGSARLRLVLGEYADGIRSAAEAEARKRILAMSIPTPLFNPTLRLRDGEVLACPDVYWEDAGLAFEVDSIKYHGDAEGLENTQQRHTRITARGVTVMHASPRRILTAWPRLESELSSAYKIGLGRPTPDVAVVPAEP